MSAAEIMRVGALDIGSNSIRLLVADVGAERRIETVARAGESCRLARGLDRSGRIDDSIADRAVRVVAEFAGRARHLGARHLVVAATAALRSAANGDEVAGRLGAAAGVAVRVLSGEEEARLVYQAVVSGLGSMSSRSSCVVFDVGGGSTEVVSGYAGEPGRWVSLDFGAVSLTERFLHSDPPAAGELDALRAHVRSILMHECAYMPAAAPLLAGVGGTVTLLACLDRGLASYEPSLIEGHAIPVARLAGHIDALSRLDQKRRQAVPVMGEGRADIVIAGAAIVGEVVERFTSPQLICSTRGLRYGLARLAADEAAAGLAGPPDATSR